MKIRLTTISGHRAGLPGPAGELLRMYVDRAARYLLCETAAFTSETAFLAAIEKEAARVRPVLWLADSRGDVLDSEAIAAVLGKYLDGGAQILVLAIGPADGWSASALKRADKTLSFGRVTLPHELAAVVAAEQIYRALTIRAGHPYHSGH